MNKEEKGTVLEPMREATAAKLHKAWRVTQGYKDDFAFEFFTPFTRNCWLAVADAALAAQQRAETPPLSERLRLVLNDREWMSLQEDKAQLRERILDIIATEVAERAETPPEPTEAQLEAMASKAWDRFEAAASKPAGDGKHRNHDKIVAMAGEVALKFDAHMGYGAWTDPAYAQDASLWNAAWRAATPPERAETPPERMRQAVELAAATFREYEALHWAKGTVESAGKAGANAALAARMEAALATPPERAETPPEPTDARFLFIQLDDEGAAYPTWCNDRGQVVDAVVAAVWGGCIVEQDDREEAAGIADALIDEGIFRFEGDMPLHLFTLATPPERAATKEGDDKCST